MHTYRPLKGRAGSLRFLLAFLFLLFSSNILAWDYGANPLKDGPSTNSCSQVHTNYWSRDDPLNLSGYTVFVCYYHVVSTKETITINYFASDNKLYSYPMSVDVYTYTWADFPPGWNFSEGFVPGQKYVTSWWSKGLRLVGQPYPAIYSSILFYDKKILNNGILPLPGPSSQQYFNGYSTYYVPLFYTYGECYLPSNPFPSRDGVVANGCQVFLSSAPVVSAFTNPFGYFDCSQCKSDLAVLKDTIIAEGKTIAPTFSQSGRLPCNSLFCLSGQEDKLQFVPTGVLLVGSVFSTMIIFRRKRPSRRKK